MFGDDYRIVFDTNQRMFEYKKTGTYAGRKVIVHMDGTESDWEVEFENGKKVSYIDMMANLKFDDGTDYRDYLKEGLINEQADYKYLTQVILDANPKMNVYYSTSGNVVNIGGVGYDKGDLVKNFNQKPGSSTKIKNNFYHANENPIDTKQEVERLSNGKIKVDIQKGYGDKPMVVYSLAESNLNEYSEYGGREVKLNKPKRGGSKAYYVYVKDPRTKKVKKVQFGSGGLRAKIKDKDKRLAFAARHKCSTKKDRTKPGYWSCNLPRYAKALKLGNNMNTYW